MKFSIRWTRLCGSSSTGSRTSRSMRFDMDKKRLEFKVGVFALVGLLILAGLLLQFSKGTSLFKPTYNLYLKAGNVGGLKKSASVLMAGVEIGKVSDIALNP